MLIDQMACDAVFLMDFGEPKGEHLGCIVGLIQGSVAPVQ